MKRNRYDEDNVVNEYYENYRRAGLTLLLAGAFLVAWLAAWWVAPTNPSQIGAAFNSLVCMVLGWGSAIFFGLSTMRYVYAFVYPRLVATRL